MTRYYILLLLALSFNASATNFDNEQEQEIRNDIELENEADARSDADSYSSSRGYGGDSSAHSGDSSARAGARGGNSQSTGGDGGSGTASQFSDMDAASNAQTGAVSTNTTAGGAEGNTTRFDSTYDSRSLALDLPSATAAPAVALECITHTRGHQVVMGVWARTGSTEYDDDCVAAMADQRDHLQCMDIVSMYMHMNEHQLAIDQLGVCGGRIGQVASRDTHAEEMSRIVEAMGVK